MGKQGSRRWGRAAEKASKDEPSGDLSGAALNKCDKSIPNTTRNRELQAVATPMIDKRPHNTQTIHLIRHGVTNYKEADPSIFDSRSVRQNVTASGLQAPPLLIVSPMTRALQTALIGFGIGGALHDEYDINVQAAKADKQSHRHFPWNDLLGVHFPEGIRVLVHPLASEFGSRAGNIGLSGDDIRTRWRYEGMVFQKAVEGWEELENDWRERYIGSVAFETRHVEDRPHFEARITALIDFVHGQQEHELALVCHSDVIKTFVRQLTRHDLRPQEGVIYTLTGTRNKADWALL